MKQFEDYFSEEAIIAELCRERVKVAKKRGDRLFWHRISSAEKKLNDEDPLSMFPPRRRWKRFRPRRRGNGGSVKVNEITLRTAVKVLRREQPEADWARRLVAQVEAIRRRVLSNKPFEFSPPVVFPAVKNVEKREFRPIASFKLDDKIIDSITARYFRERLDCALSDSCYAFRVAKDGAPPPGIHDAMRKILNMNRRHRARGLYVAECDIKGFFDCVRHSDARLALDHLIQDALRTRRVLKLEARAKEIFEAYFRCYSFAKNVLEDARPKLNRICEGGIFKWPVAELKKLHRGSLPADLGVPQGGALSCFIANAVLHEADKALKRLARRKAIRFRYLRYCDDMIIVSRTRRACAEPFKVYQAVLKRLKLPWHKPTVVKKYDKRFWEGKSRAPYRWSRPVKVGVVPWVQFVGYQIRYDGLVRVRPKSVKKQADKVTQAADQLLSVLNPGRRIKGDIGPFADGLRKRRAQIIHRFRQKLISLSVGRRKLGRSFVEPEPLCWASGFRGLAQVVNPNATLRALDRHRERQVQRIIRRLKLLRKVPATSTRKPHDALPYYGFPFSYAGQFSRSATASALAPEMDM